MQLKSRLTPAAILLVAEDNGRAIFAAAVTNTAKISAANGYKRRRQIPARKAAAKTNLLSRDGDAEKIEQALQAAHDFISGRCRD